MANSSYSSSTFPRDPFFIATGFEAAFGIRIFNSPTDFYQSVSIPNDRKDFFSYVEYHQNHDVTVYLNTHHTSPGIPLISLESARFAYLKECATAAIRAAITKGLIETSVKYPDTIEFDELSVALLDWISEKYPVYAFGSNEFAPTVTVENAAELLALMLLVDLPALYTARKSLDVKPKPVWGLAETGSDLTMTQEPTLSLLCLSTRNMRRNMVSKLDS